MRYNLLQWLIATDLTLAALLFAATSMVRKRVTSQRIREIATNCVETISDAILSSSLTNEDKCASEHQVRSVIHGAKPIFSCFSDVSLFLLSVSFWTFSAFISHCTAAIVYRFLNPSVSESFVYTTTFVFAMLYLLNAISFLLGHGTWNILFSYVTLKDLDSD